MFLTPTIRQRISALELPAQDFYPAPRSQIFYRTPPLPRLCPTPVKSPFSWRLRVPQERWFYRSADEWNAIVERLKQTPCPHCKVVGTLIRHGFLYGFDDSSPQRKTLRD